MKSIRLSDALVSDDILIVGLAKGAKADTLKIESGSVSLDEKSLLSALKDLGATGAANEITKLPGSTTRLLIFTGLGEAKKDYAHEVLRRAAGAASRALAGEKSAAVALPTTSIEQVAAVVHHGGAGAACMLTRTC
jgi:leucyl aminopeptidase